MSTNPWAQVDGGTLRWGNYAVIKVSAMGTPLYHPLLLERRHWLHLNEGFACDDAQAAKDICDKHAWETDIAEDGQR